jgi:hypothetical protein
MRVKLVSDARWELRRNWFLPHREENDIYYFEDRPDSSIIAIIGARRLASGSNWESNVIQYIDHLTMNTRYRRYSVAITFGDIVIARPALPCLATLFQEKKKKKIATFLPEVSGLAVFTFESAPLFRVSSG